MIQLFSLILIMISSMPILNGQNITIETGSASTTLDGLQIYYHKPKNFTPNSPILLVIPGAGRNADDYRDAWVSASEKHSILVVSPSYPEKEYGYGDYHLGGMVQNLDLSKGVTPIQGTNQIHIDENQIEYRLNPKAHDWIYMDFDRIFNAVKKATSSRQNHYDMFGHSAGGQILHRMALFHPNSKANRIVASNAGTYTLPDYETDFPFGVKNVGIPKQSLEKSFNRKLILLLGELDNDLETRGTMLRSKTADKQGTNRLDRGTNFYRFSQKTAKSMGVAFHWKLKTIPNVGHDKDKMTQAAARYLYPKNKVVHGR